jgi:hypothetical protein
MTQASGKGARYRYYKCTTRLNKNVDACTAKNLPREQTDDMVLAALSERVFPPKHVSIMLNELLRHQQQAKTAEDARLITLKKELDRATTGLDRLYQAVEEGARSIDETLRIRTRKLKARRREVLTEMAKLGDRNALAVRARQRGHRERVLHRTERAFHRSHVGPGQSVPATARRRDQARRQRIDRQWQSPASGRCYRLYAKKKTRRGAQLR